MQSLLEEYGPEYVHVKGKDNIVADALSCMEADYNPDQADSKRDQKDQEMNQNMHVAIVCLYNITTDLR
jgi:hypothetical protein